MFGWMISALASTNENIHHVNEVSHQVAENAHHSAGPVMPEVGNFVTLLNSYFHDNPIVHFLHEWENPFYSIIAAIILILFFSKAIRKQSMIPDRFQAFAEIVMEGLSGIVVGIMGRQGKKYIPFISTIFVYIWLQNMFGLIPFMKAPTSSLNTTFGLAICVFGYVQFIGITKNGILGYLHHLMGSPKDVVGWMLSPLMFFLHVVGEFIKPISLALRLFGNIMGEDTLIGVFAGIGIVILGFIHSPIGIPIQFPLMLLSILLGTIQALVFSLLSAIYIFLMLPHEEHH